MYFIFEFPVVNDLSRLDLWMNDGSYYMFEQVR